MKDAQKSDHVSLTTFGRLREGRFVAETNRNVIGDCVPNKCLPERIAAGAEASVRATLESHFVSLSFAMLLRDPLTTEDFEALLAERQRTLQDATEDLLAKAWLDLPPQRRELGARIEEVELALRRGIEEALDGDPVHLPSLVGQKVEERLQAAAKNAAHDGERYGTLAAELEYADLRELRDTITNETLWPRSEACFAHKVTLAKRFGQLADLRNGIRHSRSVDEITRKEGEAAIPWLGQVIGQ